MARTQSVFPALGYRDAAAAIDWLAKAFGFEEHAVHHDPDGVVVHAELRTGDDLVMLGTDRNDDRGVAPRAGRGCTYVVVDDPDAHHERAAAAGAEIVRALEDTDYGSREYSARDPEGNVWSFGTYRPTL